MLDFILSKLNLLILVTAIFAIVSFFAASLGDIAKVREAVELTSKIKEQSFSLVNSPNYCFSDSFLIPDELTVAGGTYYYVLKVSKQELSGPEGNTVGMLIFSVFPRDEAKRAVESGGTYSPKSIAADSFRTNAELHIYAPDDYTGSSYNSRAGSPTEEQYIYIDPQAVNPKNSIEFVKEVVNGQTHFYVMPCNRAAAGCVVQKEKIGEVVHGNGSGFLC